MRRSSTQNRQRVSDNMKVSELLVNNGREWNMELLDVLFSKEVKEHICAVNPVGGESEESYSCGFTKTVHYTVKSGYWVQMNISSEAQEEKEVLQPSIDCLYQQVRKLDTSPKIHHFLWRSLSNSLPVGGNMTHRHISKDSCCSRCGQENETVNHLLFTFPTQLIWAMAPIHTPPQGTFSDSLLTNLHWVLNFLKRVPK